MQALHILDVIDLGLAHPWPVEEVDASFLQDLGRHTPPSRPKRPSLPDLPAARTAKHSTADPRRGSDTNASPNHALWAPKTSSTS
jgi:hypothetical protein